MLLDGIIGIVAGASTPDTMIREVYDYMIENEKVLPIEGEEETASILLMQPSTRRRPILWKKQPHEVQTEPEESIEVQEEPAEEADS